MRFLALCFLIVVSSSAHAIDENNFEVDYYNEVVPTIEANSETGTFSGVDGVPIHYMVVQPELAPGETPKGALVIVNGRTESLYTYYEFMYDLRHLGFTIYTYDHRGQGASGRLIDDTHKSYVEDFGHYVDDLETLIDTVVLADGHHAVFLHGQSMGGCVAATFAERHPDKLKGLIVTAPMMKINTGSIPETAAYGVAALNCTIGRARSYAPGAGPFDPATWEQDITNSEVRWKVQRDWLIDNPDMVIGGATNKWVKEAIEGTRQVRDRAGEIKTPMILFQATDDNYVVSDGQNLVCDRARNCEKVIVVGAKHGLTIEEDGFRSAMLQKIEEFILDLY
jgi:lysophospholipase